MHAAPWHLRMRVAFALVAAGSMTAAAASRGVDNGRTMVTQQAYVYRAEDNVFTGTVVTNDLKAKTLTIEGHHPLRRETVDVLVPLRQAGRLKQGDKPPPVKDSTLVFQVDTLCRVALTNKPSARTADVQSGDVVDVEYRKMAGGAMIVSVIQTAVKHPYDTPPANKPRRH